jgi:hypothetical protein
MKRLDILIALLFALVATALAAEPPLANAGRKGLEARSIDDMLALPDEEIDIGPGALLIGKEHDPDLNVTKYLGQLDAMARELRSRVGGEKDPTKIIATMNDCVFRGKGFSAIDPKKGQPQDAFLHVLLDERKAQHRASQPCTSRSPNEWASRSRA